VARIITVIIFGGFGVFMLYMGITQLAQQRRNLAHAEPIEAVVVKSEVFASTSADTDPRLLRSTSTTTYRADITFRYTVSGQTYESDRLYPSIIVQTFASHADAAAMIKSFPVGATVRAFADRAHPERAFLLKESGSGPVVFIVLGLLLPPIAWIVGKYI
jgi:Protein of unknown function (DUF3592)